MTDTDNAPNYDFNEDQTKYHDIHKLSWSDAFGASYTFMIIVLLGILISLTILFVARKRPFETAYDSVPIYSQTETENELTNDPER